MCYVIVAPGVKKALANVMTASLKAWQPDIESMTVTFTFFAYLVIRRNAIYELFVSTVKKCFINKFYRQSLNHRLEMFAFTRSACYS